MRVSGKPLPSLLQSPGWSATPEGPLVCADDNKAEDLHSPHRRRQRRVERDRGCQVCRPAVSPPSVANEHTMCMPSAEALGPDLRAKAKLNLIEKKKHSFLETWLH